MTSKSSIQLMVYESECCDCRRRSPRPLTCGNGRCQNERRQTCELPYNQTPDSCGFADGDPIFVTYEARLGQIFKVKVPSRAAPIDIQLQAQYVRHPRQVCELLGKIADHMLKTYNEEYSFPRMRLFSYGQELKGNGYLYEFHCGQQPILEVRMRY